MNSEEASVVVAPPDNGSIWDLIRPASPNVGVGTDWDAVFCCLRNDPGQAGVYENQVSPLQFILSRPVSVERPPARIINDLLHAHPEAARCVHARDGSTALFQATYNGHEAEIVRLVLRANVDAARTTNSFGDLPLHVARTEEVARMLLEAYPEGLCQRSHWSSLPLHTASSMIYTEPAVLRLFLEEGKRRGIGGPIGGGGVFLRGAGGKPAHVRLLETIVGLTEKGADGAPYFLDDIGARCCWEKLVLITEEISSACARDEDGDLPFEVVGGGSILHSMIQLEYPPKVIWLATEALRPELIHERDGLGRTPLAAAAAIGGDAAPREVIRVLLAAERPGRGGRRSRAAGMADAEGKLPLHLAIESGRNFEDGIEDLMRAQPRALIARDEKKGLYPFMLAAEDDRGTIDCLFNLMEAAPHVAVPRE